VAYNSLISQLRGVVVDPPSASGISCVTVIDALDECIDDQPASAILSVLGQLHVLFGQLLDAGKKWALAGGEGCDTVRSPWTHFYPWNFRSNWRRSGSRVLYRELNACPSVFANGFRGMYPTPRC
jgi:hypothetical protein